MNLLLKRRRTTWQKLKRSSQVLSENFYRIANIGRRPILNESSCELEVPNGTSTEILHTSAGVGFLTQFEIYTKSEAVDFNSIASVR